MKNTDPPDSTNMGPKLNAELTRFIESMGRYFETYGIPRIGGRILGLLLISHDPLSAESIARILKVSRGSISTNFKLLLTSGLAEKVSFPSDRTTYYTFPVSAWGKTMAAELEAVASLQKLARQGISALPPGDAAARRLEEMIEWTDLIYSFYSKTLTEWQERQNQKDERK